ncbi:MAG: NAD/FAD-binding protein [Rhodospirillales bacterium]|nr:NAD/FAD-binding protein [Rhodospirillales bacterium]
MALQLGQNINLLRPMFWKMLFDIKRFYKKAPIDLRTGNLRGLTLRDYLEKENYSYSFIVDHILPMGAAIWSSPSMDINNYPAESFVRFFESHNLLKLGKRSSWRTVTGGSRNYIDRLTADFTDKIYCNVNVKQIIRHEDNVEVIDDKGNRNLFDEVILALHADEAIKLIYNPTKTEHQILSRFSYTSNSAFLHKDSTFMPKRKRVWASWNYINNEDSDNISPQVTYWVSNLQNLSYPKNLFLTLNPNTPPSPSKTYLSIKYHHPLFDTEAIKGQRQLSHIQGKNKTWFCGSYFGYGFHEDALQSGLWVAENLGRVKRPWSLPEQNDRLIASND